MWCWTISLLVHTKLDGGEPGVLLKIMMNPSCHSSSLLPHYSHTQTVYHRTKAKQVQYNDVKVLCRQEQLDFSFSLQSFTSGTVQFNTHRHVHLISRVFLSDSVQTFLSSLCQRTRASEELKVQFFFVSYCTLIFLSHSVTLFFFHFIHFHIFLFHSRLPSSLILFSPHARTHKARWKPA